MTLDVDTLRAMSYAPARGNDRALPNGDQPLVSMKLTSRHSLVVGLFAVAVGLASPAAAEWRRIDSPNFVVVGDVPARALSDVALKFEGFREALTRALTERPTSTPVPTVIVVFPTDKAFVPFKPIPHAKPVSMSGMFVARPDINYAAVVMDGKSDALAAVFHEYAHVVIANTTRNAPMWLSEGLAEYYSTYELGKDGREEYTGGPSRTICGASRTRRRSRWKS